MITAQEALYLSTKNVKNKEIPKEVEEGILNSCDLGNFKYEYQGVMEKEIEWLLQSLGYKVNRLIILGKPVTKISWNK